MLEEFFTTVKESQKSIPACQFSPLSIAYVGDAVFELCARTKALRGENRSIRVLNLEVREYVKAENQAKMYHHIFKHLTEEEQGVIQRGRNAKSFNSTKNASTTEYRHATGLEALFGYLYLKGEPERIMELFRLCSEVV